MSKDMNFTSKVSKTFYVTFFLLSFVVVEVFYLQMNKSMSTDDKERKNSFVKLIGLPDLAISNESSFIRHRSVSDLFSIYSNDPSLREYSKITFSTSPRDIN
jgi:hypothetical protein